MRFSFQDAYKMQMAHSRAQPIKCEYFWRLANHELVILPSSERKLRKNALCLNQSAFSNFALYVIKVVKRNINERRFFHVGRLTSVHSFYVIHLQSEHSILVRTLKELTVIYNIAYYPPQEGNTTPLKTTAWEAIYNTE